MSTVDYNDLAAVDPWWTVVGVFPQETDNNGANWWDSFCYTVGLTPDFLAPERAPGFEVWVPTASIEGRQAGHHLTGMYLNRIAPAIAAGDLLPGDDVRVPIGVAGHEDDDDLLAVWWVGLPEPARYRQANLGHSLIVIPLLWSSPLGWAD